MEGSWIGRHFGHGIQDLLRGASLHIAAHRRDYSSKRTVAEADVKARICLIYKDGDPSDPANYRPMQCSTAITNF